MLVARRVTSGQLGLYAGRTVEPSNKNIGCSRPGGILGSFCDDSNGDSLTCSATFSGGLRRV
jgi:hypothetical protein